MTFYEKTTLDFSPVANSQTADRQGDIAMNPHDPTLIPLPIELCVRGSPVPARPPARKQPPYLVPGLLLDHGLGRLLDISLLPLEPPPAGLLVSFPAPPASAVPGHLSLERLLLAS